VLNLCCKHCWSGLDHENSRLLTDTQQHWQSYDRECHYPAEASRPCRRMWRSQQLHAGRYMQQMQHAFHRQLLASSSMPMMPHPRLGPYGEERDNLLPAYTLYDEEYLSNAWAESDSLMDAWPDQDSTSQAATVMDIDTGPSMMVEAAPACAQPATDELESTIIVRQTPPDAAANSEYEDFLFDTPPISTPLTSQALTGDTLHQPGGLIEEGGRASTACPTPGDLVSGTFSSPIPMSVLPLVYCLPNNSVVSEPGDRG
jgi:hypothetical protein